MYGVKAAAALALLSFTFCAGSCARMNANGRDTDLLALGVVGWQQMGGQEGTWRFQDGVLYTEGENGGWLATQRQYENFAMALEFRVAPGSNSGVFFRAPLTGDPAYAGLEIQILDDYAQRWSGLEAHRYTGSIYGVQAPVERVSKEAGQWQKMVIVARGPHIQVGLNGRKILDTELTHHSHKADMHPGLMRTSGYIGLQSHSSRVEFRKIKIREL